MNEERSAVAVDTEETRRKLADVLLEAEPEHDRRPRCSKCALHRAKIGEERASRYSYELGETVRLKCQSGTIDVCPGCTGLTLNGVKGTLATLGVLNRAQRRSLRLSI